jgi:ATP-dependent protease ClpP protease subunit
MTMSHPGWLPGPPRPDPVPPTVVHLDPRREELAEQLWRRRVVLLSGRLDGPAAEAAVGRILLADADGPDPIQLHVHCQDIDFRDGRVLSATEARDLGLVHEIVTRGGQSR